MPLSPSGAAAAWARERLGGRLGAAWAPRVPRSVRDPRGSESQPDRAAVPDRVFVSLKVAGGVF